MTGVAWLTLLVTFGVAIMSPGPDTFLLLRLGVRDRGAAMRAALGIMLGNTLWTVASVAGLAALLRALPGMLPALQVAGSFVLIWIGARSIAAGIRGFRTRGASDAAVQIGTIRHPLRLGLISNLANPKALLFFTALFSQILPAQAPLLDRALIVLALTSVGLGWFLCFAWLTSSRAFQRWFGRATPVIDIVAGGVFILVAMVILVETARTLIPQLS